MKDLKELYPDELKEELLGLGEKAFRAGQIYDWMHRKLAKSSSEMSNLSLKLREQLGASYSYTCFEPELVQTSKEDGTKKYLFTLSDGERIESVFMRYHHGNTVCISTQVGCRMGCRFCASTLGGRIRDLSAAEMLEQIYAITRDTGERIGNIVVMGIGEPLDNYAELIRFLRMITGKEGLNISQRSITVSSCGLVPQIRDLAGEDLAVTLAISLHAASDEKRRRIMPVAQRYSIDELMGAADFYFVKTGRRVSFEYALIAGENDKEEDVAALSALAAPRHCHVNLIPVNPVTETGMKEPDRDAVQAFCVKLNKRGVTATIRRELGRDIDGACGQLRRKAGGAGVKQ
ncbi:MAG: 23S rRNA (adenine(2503)-C(2))-methyltransferase RlmN [Lachnospiraceae bacterium]|nr:23S rRNA (adenine(2503)-C(2))-methyltransferase RlmN [Lachnospiraceae bacterium]